MHNEFQGRTPSVLGRLGYDMGYVSTLYIFHGYVILGVDHPHVHYLDNITMFSRESVLASLTNLCTYRISPNTGEGVS